MRKTLGTIAAVAILAGATNAWAVEDNPLTRSLENPFAGGASGGPEVNANTDFEPPAWVIGPPAQNGWITANSPGWTISNVTPIAGLQDATHAPTQANQLSRLVSPTEVPATFGLQSALVRFDTIAAGAAYGLEILGTGANINARVLLFEDFDIEVLQAPGGVGVFTDIGDWVPGQAVKIGVETLADGTQRIYLNDVLAFTGQDINFQVTGIVATPNRASANGFSGAVLNGRGSVDNFSAIPIPEPASLTLLGVGALALLRRRA